ncbi:oligosaccharide flippase family protein [Murimonas intestini]|uniref:O-antigen/teichoic acid export membrane protein n=1 Tax=Murimonas intestini TaxID=1337051 RepID=A0AB73T8Z4_9FIRM|nr:oligosaccharide flippase family protein [Murimonas intestini]MCR1839495.1 oligosaccharide flippase family protein [Murimonas intestini]MCR1867963.1 oligosaccharide flippase family protein [Murimonas intestini]MCR1882399.1 oligosaccharide flippase family protein [Murimonas intestini]
MLANAFYNVLYQIATLLMPIITTPYISRILGPEGIGEYVLGDTYSQYFILIGSLGLALYSSREIAYVRDNDDLLRKTFWELVLIRIPLVGTASIIYFVIFFVFGVKESYVNKIFLINIISSIFDISWFFIGIEDFKKRALKSVIIKILAVVCVFFLVKQANHVWLYALIICSGNLLGQLVMWPDLPTNIRRISKLTLCSFKRHFKGSLSIFASIIIIRIYTLFDRLMLGEMANNSSVAFYDNSQKIIRGIATLLTASIQAITPRLANYYINKQEKEFQNNNYNVFRIVNMLGFPLCMGLIGIANTFSVWYYGEKFMGINLLLIVGAPTIISLGWTGVFSNNILISTGKQRVLTIAVFVGALTDVVLNLFFISKYKSLAATLSTLAAEIIGLLIMLYGVRKILPIKPFFTGSLRYLFLSLCMGMFVYFIGFLLPISILSTLIQVLCGGFFYILGLILLKDSVFFDLIYKLKQFRKK